MKMIQSVLAAMMLALYLSVGFGGCENINTMLDWELSRKN